jgi:hypothetical protein
MRSIFLSSLDFREDAKTVTKKSTLPEEYDGYI